jgi:hypothetical protein
VVGRSRLRGAGAASIVPPSGIHDHKSKQRFNLKILPPRNKPAPGMPDRRAKKTLQSAYSNLSGIIRIRI